MSLPTDADQTPMIIDSDAGPVPVPLHTADFPATTMAAGPAGQQVPEDMDASGPEGVPLIGETAPQTSDMAAGPAHQQVPEDMDTSGPEGAPLPPPLI
eukprot:3890705-Amphidinium_carterae.1